MATSHPSAAGHGASTWAVVVSATATRRAAAYQSPAPTWRDLRPSTPSGKDNKPWTEIAMAASAANVATT